VSGAIVRRITRMTISLAILFTAGPARAETKIQAIAQEIETDAKLENPRLGLDTLIRAAERLRSVDPATARHLLDVGTPWLASFPAPSYFTYRFMISYPHGSRCRREGRGGDWRQVVGVHGAHRTVGAGQRLRAREPPDNARGKGRVL